MTNRIRAAVLATVLPTAVFTIASHDAVGDSPSAQARTRVVYVSVTDGKGSVLTSLVAADFAVKEDGKSREVVRAELATGQLQIALIVDDNGTGLFRYGLATFVQRLQGRAAMALSTVVGQTVRVVDYTTSVAALAQGLSSLNARAATPDGGQLLEGIYEAARELQRRKAERPVIIALTVGGEEHSTLPAHHVLDQLRQSGASLHVVSVANSALRSRAPVTRPSQLLEENLNLSEVLGDGPKQSGGRRDEIVASAGLMPGLQQLAEELVNQYLVAYVLPAGVKPSSKISVSLTRPGLTLRAPTRVPDRPPAADR